MTDSTPNKRDVRRVAAALGIKYTQALRMVEAVPVKDRHQFVLDTEAKAQGEEQK